MLWSSSMLPITSTPSISWMPFHMAPKAAHTSSCSSRGASMKFWLMPMQNRTRKGFLSLMVYLLVFVQLQITRQRVVAEEHGACVFQGHRPHEGMLGAHHGVAHDAGQRMIVVGAGHAGHFVGTANRIGTLVCQIGGREADQIDLLAARLATGQNAVPGVFGGFVEERSR